ncbi:MAG: outer membrane lipoprotein-sorting protein [Acidobacteriota bacterium]|nr:outer membrane lipoprotein-sorting protein [Acidobacteriota bacterium]
MILMISLPNPRLTRMRLAVLAAVLAITANASAQAKPAVIAQMNEASAKFTSAQADVRQELFTKALNDTETQTGEIYFLHKAGATQMGMKMLAADAKPGAAPAQIIEFKDNKLQVLNTGTSQVDVFTATGKNQSLAETLMTLGFGGSGTDLQKAWTITDQGSETLRDGNQPIQTEKLDLVSKDQGIRNTYAHIIIWVDLARDVSVKQTLFEASGSKPTGDTRTVYYSNIRLNQPVKTDAFAIKCKGKCTLVQH